MIDDLLLLKPLISFFFFIFGTVFGSFFNVCISRIPRKESIIPDSHCPNCNYKIRAFDNIPLFSYFILRGKCRNCGLKIKPIYPIVELLGGLLFLSLFLKFSLSLLLVKYLILFSILLIIFFIDANHLIIPDVLSIPLVFIGLAFSFLPNMDISIFDSFVGAFSGFIFFYSVAYFYYKITKKEGMGGGDIKLIAAIGAFVGWIGVLFTIIASSILFILFFVIMQKKKESQIPYGPFLVLGTLLYIICGMSVWNWYLEFSFNLLDKIT